MAGPTEIVLLNRIEELPRLQQALDAFAEKHGLERKVLIELNLILEELVTNVIYHGYEDDAEHQITIGLALEAGRLRIEVEDDGRYFNPRDVPTPDVEASLEERPCGGLGLHLVRSLVDELKYQRSDGRNLLVLVKSGTREP